VVILGGWLNDGNISKIRVVTGWMSYQPLTVGYRYTIGKNRSLAINRPTSQANKVIE
jgi:hypothetical protein